VKNQEIARIFYQIADFLDIQGVAFRPNAYRRGARIIEELQEDVAKIKQRGELTGIQGIGKNLANKIGEYLKTGEIGLHNRLKREVPPGLLDIISVPGLGPKTAGYLYKEKGISSLEELEKAAKERRLRQMKGFGQKTEENVLKGIEMLKRMKGRILLGEALPIAQEIIEEIESKCKVERICVAGSVRRMKEAIGDIDILVVSEDPGKTMDVFSSISGVQDVIVKGRTKTSVYLKDGLQADLRVVDLDSYGAALQYFTGSKDHNIHLRKIAQKMGYKVNEYGLFEGERKIAGETEKELYETLEMTYIEPELREDNGEIEASQKGKLPNLVRLEDIKGDLHVHTNWSDGTESIEDLAKIAQGMGYEYIAVADHSKSLKVAGGLDEDELMLQVKEIRKINKRIKGFKILAGIEVDILGNGELDLDDSALKEMDVVVGAIHSKFSMSEKEMTERVLEAIRNENLDILAHPTGRLIGRRNPYEADIDKIMRESADTKTALEINCFPDRLDLNGPNAKRAKQMGAKISLGTDTHAASNLYFMKFGVGMARRGWLESKDVLNTWSAKEILDYLK